MYEFIISIVDDYIGKDIYLRFLIAWVVFFAVSAIFQPYEIGNYLFFSLYEPIPHRNP